MTIWTSYGEFVESGVGQHLFVLITYADSEEEMKKKLFEKFPIAQCSYFEIHEGVIENDFTLKFFSSSILKHTKSVVGRSSIELYSGIHFNGG